VGEGGTDHGHDVVLLLENLNEAHLLGRLGPRVEAVPTRDRNGHPETRGIARKSLDPTTPTRLSHEARAQGLMSRRCDKNVIMSSFTHVVVPPLPFRKTA